MSDFFEISGQNGQQLSKSSVFDLHAQQALNLKEQSKTTNFGMEGEFSWGCKLLRALG
jgi:hypothetical protein